MAGYIEFDKVSKRYRSDIVESVALNDVSFTIDKGEFCVLVGSSGAGKTTALNILGGIDRCSSGLVRVGDREISSLSDRDLTKFRRFRVGFVFQFYNLVQSLTAEENVQLATDVSNKSMGAAEVLEMVGLSDKRNSFPAQLSGGEQQRVAIARAIAKQPQLLLCDEPTGALDDVNGRHILKTIQSLSRQKGMTVVLITHNLAITKMATKVIRMRSGRIVGVECNAQPKPAEEILL
jgi:putative ABC transport system ATP-binding protein